ncbi:MAG: hypothetical protein LWW94_04265 [Candidatus Desulfofervidaceae bacterium]|nr:hypothetical protein [Candidatus Desulfofervidaceae bacterium]
MRLIIWLIGLVWIVMGLCSVLVPHRTKNMMQKYIGTKKIQVLAGIVLLMGILLVVGSFKARIHLYVLILGFLALLKGILLFIKPEIAQKIVNWWLNRSERAYQIGGLVVYTLGLFLLIWG